jgi:hypothetical protein
MIMAAKIMWKQGARINGNAEDIHAELERMRSTGDLTAERLVEESKPSDHVAHAAIWSESDAKAAHEWRLSLARHVMRSIVVVRKEPKRGAEIITRAFEVVRRDETRESKPRNVYEDIDTILSDIELRAQVLQRAISDAKAFRTKYEKLSELSAVIREISRLVDGSGQT